MWFLPVSLALFVLFLLLIPVIFALAPVVVFDKLGLNPFLGYAFFILCLVGGSINIPLRREEIVSYEPPDPLLHLFHTYFGIRVPDFRQRILAVNLGGAVLPGLLCLYLLPAVPVSQVIIATAVTTAAAYTLSRPVQGIGVVMPAFVPPVIAAITAVLISREQAPRLAYISGVLGTLIGADVLRLSQVRRLGAPFLSIGGAGVFDGIYLVGIVSVLLA
jgi:uncharacterized membrane protein